MKKGSEACPLTNAIMSHLSVIKKATASPQVARRKEDVAPQLRCALRKLDRSPYPNLEKAMEVCKDEVSLPGESVVDHGVAELSLDADTDDTSNEPVSNMPNEQKARSSTAETNICEGEGSRCDLRRNVSRGTGEKQLIGDEA